jgi:DNA invertase Pin-like site-specific DNA recombinase
VKKYLAYTRVSTTRQGEQGVSLQQQRESIEQFAARSGLQISDWLEEQETAAKLGRPVFMAMLKSLRRNEAAGVIIHKIDRSARNLKDWAELGQLIDQGIEVHFSNEAVDLTSRGGRLSADIQAVVSADYIRNLREEVKKGFYGRLKQGFMPMPAPLGYLDAGAGKPKQIDPAAGPIIRKGFDLYATGRYTQAALTLELNRLGLRTRRGKPVSKNAVSRILTNRFYTGVIHLRRSGQIYKGLHEPLISPKIFQRVLDVLTGRIVRGPGTHDFTFSRFITCETCGRSLIGERQKNHVYYRCHIRSCPPTSLNEKAIQGAITQKIERLGLTAIELEWIEEFAAIRRQTAGSTLEEEVKQLRLQIAAHEERQNRLTDAFVDGVLERVDHDRRKAALTLERCELDHRLASSEAGLSEAMLEMEKKIELIKRAWLLHQNGFRSENRDLVTELTSNRTASGKSIVITMQSPLEAIIKRPKSTSGGSLRGEARTFWEKFLQDSTENNESQERAA